MKNLRKKTDLGRLGERLASRYLEEQGIRVLDKNWYYRQKEIDIVAEDDRYLIIVEVKTRRGGYLEAPGGMVPRKKQRFLVEAAEAYVHQFAIEKEVRFDVIIILFANKQHKLEHIRDAFLPGI